MSIYFKTYPNAPGKRVKLRLILFIILLALILVSPMLLVAQPTDCTTQTDIPQAECEALVTLYNTTDGSNWNTNTGWNDTQTPCSWHGVTCQAGHVTWLDLNNNQLSGSIPPELGNLSNWEGLYLNYNMLTASDTALIDFLDDKAPGWNTTQTISPGDVQTGSPTETSVTVSWMPILYTADSGYYEVGYSTTSGGPYTSGGQTVDKSASSLDVSGLTSGTTYYFAVRTFTPAHDENQNDLTSAWSTEVFTQTSGEPAPGDGMFQVNTLPVIPATPAPKTVAMSDYGSYVIVWLNTVQEGSVNRNIFARRYDVAGQPQGIEFQVNTSTEEEHHTPAVAIDAAGNFVVAWSRRVGWNDSMIFWQRYNSNGEPLGTEFQVNTPLTGYHILPDVAMDAAGNFVVVWMNSNASAILGQRYNSNGEPLGTEFQIFSSLTFLSSPVVAMNANGDFNVVWITFIEDQGLQVMGQRYSSNGDPLGIPFQVNTIFLNSTMLPDVALEANGRFIVVWTYINGDYTESHVMGQRYDSDGLPLGDEFQVNTTSTPFYPSPIVEVDNDGNFVVLWETRDTDNIYNIHGQHYNADGLPQGGEFQVINTDGVDMPILPSVSMNSDGDFVVTWLNYHQGDNEFNIFARRYAQILPRLVLPVSADFGSVQMGSISEPQTITLTNMGQVMMSISGISIQPDDTQFSILMGELGDCGATLEVSVSCNIRVIFHPTTEGEQTAALHVESDAVGNPHEVMLSGTGIDDIEEPTPDPTDTPTDAPMLTPTSTPTHDPDPQPTLTLPPTNTPMPTVTLAPTDGPTPTLDPTSTPESITGLTRVAPADGAVWATGGDYVSKFQWAAQPDAEWYHVFVSTPDFSMIFFDRWYMSSQVCTGEICTLPDDVWLVGSGEFAWWMTYWNSSVGDDYIDLYNESRFTVTMPTPGTLTGGAYADGTLTWQDEPNTLWYNVWVGPADYSGTSYLMWHDAADICSEGTCSLNIGILPVDDYELWLQGWNPVGLTEGESGWQKLAEFSTGG